MEFLRKTKPISAYQFAVFRITFGLYLTVHFIQLLPYAGELFSAHGVIGDPRLNPFYGVFPNPLAIWDAPVAAEMLLILSTAVGLAFTLGVFRRSTALLLWFAWACLFNRNNLISNPGLPYIGLLLILCALLPRGDRWTVTALRRGAGPKDRAAWYFPAWIYWTAWILHAAGYTFSGLVKLASPSWVNGETMMMLLENPLARDGIFREIALNLPAALLKLSTWAALALEILFLGLSFTRRTRLWAWALMIVMHLGLVLIVDFADLTLGMIMIHLFVFDPDWFPTPEKLRGKRNVVFFDGVCMMCNDTVKFLSSEDNRRMLYFAPLQGDTYGNLHPGAASPSGEGFESIVFVESVGTECEREFTHSTAIVRILRAMGGFWRAGGFLLALVPRAVRDGAYRVIAKYRYRWFGKTKEVCELPTSRERERMLI